MAQDVTVICSLDGASKDGQDSIVCAEMTAAAARFYPDTTFHAAPADGGAKPPSGDRLQIVIRHASRQGVGLQLIWTMADGREARGEVLSVSSMDRDLDQARRTSLYLRALAATPKPI